MSKKLCGSSFPYYRIINRSDGTAGEDAPLFQMCSYDNKFYARRWGECWTNDFKTINADLFSRRVEKINAESRRVYCQFGMYRVAKEIFIPPGRPHIAFDRFAVCILPCGRFARDIGLRQYGKSSKTIRPRRMTSGKRFFCTGSESGTFNPLNDTLECG